MAHKPRKVYSADGSKEIGDSDLPVVKVKRRKRVESERSQYLKWWLCPTGDDAKATLWQWIDRQRSTWAGDAIADLIAESVYSDTPITAGGRLGGDGRWLGPRGGLNPINQIKNLVDTGTSRLTKVRSMPVISADDATYEEKRFATEQSRVLRRKMGSGDMELVAPLIIRDFMIRGTAHGKVERDGGDTTFCRVPSYEIVFDHREALYNRMSHRAHVRPESRDELRAKYPNMAEAIDEAPPFTRIDPWMTYTYVGPNLADMVEVAEAWHPPSKPGGDDGQWILCLRNKTIARAPWKCSRDPIVTWYWTPPTRGCGRGTGLVYEQAAAQMMVNDILQDAREALHHGSQLKVFQPRGGGSNKHHLKARHPAVIEYDAVRPEYVAPNVVSEQAWNIAFQILGEMNNSSGIASWASQARAPLPGTPSGKAVETMVDLQSDRFASVESNYQQGRVAVGLRHVDLARMMHDEAHGETEKVFEEQPDPIKKDELAAWIRENSWPDVDIDGGDYHLTLEPENFIVGARGSKLQQVQEAAQSGLIPDPSLEAAMFDEPDIARANRGIIGPVRRIEKCLSDLANLKVPYRDCQPDFEMNRPLAKLLALGELEQSKADGASDQVQQRFRDFLADIKRIDDAQAAAAAASAPSLQGAQANNIVAQTNAGDLMGGGGGPPAAGPPGQAPLPPGVS